MTAVDDRRLWVVPEPEPVPPPRTAPPDRRAEVPVARGKCPMGSGCGCCTGSTNVSHGRAGKATCRRPHPETDRMCRLPCPADIPPCAERTEQPQNAAGLHAACCVECGRITARRWSDPEGRSLAWCAGTMPEKTTTEGPAR